MIKNKFLTLSICIFLVLPGIGLLLYSSSVMGKKSRLVVQPIDEKGFFVGDEKKVIEPDHVSEYWKQAKGIDDAWENIGIGNSYYQTGDYEKALGSYSKAYAMDTGSRTFIGFKLIETYEKLKRYDDALAVLGDIVNPNWSQKGIQKASETRARLLTAKENSKEPSR